MIVIGKTVVSDDIAEKFFVCDLAKCKGACCVEGDLGAPLEDAELAELENSYNQVKPYLSEEGVKAIEEQGLYVKDSDDEFSTPTIAGRECAYAIYDKNVLKCGIEKAWLEGKITFKKPVSCHLYPIRITKYDHYEAVNYDRWEICNPACKNGKSLGVPLYKFLKDSLLRKYGAEWYKELEMAIDHKNNTPPRP